MPLSYQHNVENCLARTIGSNGLLEEHLDDALQSLTKTLPALQESLRSGALPAFTIVQGMEDLTEVMPVALEFRQNCRDVLILGTGGSSLGGRTLCGLNSEALPSGASPGRENGPVLHFIDNIDPYSFQKLLDRLELARTGLIVISKSGSTAETMSQFMALLPLFQEAHRPEDLSRFICVITEPSDNPLRRMARRLGVSCLDHDPNIGGRYSVFSLVGMLPALIAGLDIRALRQGAADVLEAFLSADHLEDNAPAAGAALAVQLNARLGIASTVIMPYEDRLADLGLWFNQLWAESLGKDGRGTTPIRALGTVDQHSQLQLYLDGPADKMFTILHHDSRGEGLPIDAFIGDEESLDYLQKRTLGDLLFVSAEATRDALASNWRPVRHILMDAIDERSLGAIMMHFMLETILAAELLGIDPYDQPAVEQGKVIARQKLRAMPL
ncbi:glucose-6-phosphate isomerase [Kiloniella sp. b19]|uniref:glucose-6-phosphate isomerase n=1 Tax=Kiloniella sp. GXU_MW_B19 TaxID=3141326 RepID=UPI0031DAAC7A